MRVQRKGHLKVSRSNIFVQNTDKGNISTTRVSGFNVLLPGNTINKSCKKNIEKLKSPKKTVGSISLFVHMVQIAFIIFIGVSLIL